MPKPNWFGESILIPVADPGAGSFFDVIAPAGQLLHVLGIKAVFTADATVITRYMYISWFAGVGLPGMLLEPTAITASTIRGFNASSLYTGVPYNVLTDNFYPLGPFCYVSNAVYLRVNCMAIRAGDTWTSIVVICERMLDE